ncbi:MAG TPA: hypothetical protein ENN56_00975 [Firmicutes bacterium]|nr:hypothetical protein [Bacillota bacterium]
MWRVIRVIAGAITIVCVVLVALSVKRQMIEIDEWELGVPLNAVSELPPLERTITDLYAEPIAPGRRVRLLEPFSVRDTFHAVRPILSSDGRSIGIPEELVFLEDPTTGMRMAIVRPAGTPTDDWIELMPMPRDVTHAPRFGRWTPLAHWSDIWHPGWADANNPEPFMWLGMTSDLIRAHDIAGDPTEIPYRVKKQFIAGAPGGPKQPAILTPRAFVLSLVAIVGLFVALHGQRLIGRTT